MSKDEIIQKCFSFKHSVERFTIKAEVRNVMDVYAKQECIEFLNWIFKNWRETEDSGNPEELYESYLQSKQI